MSVAPPPQPAISPNLASQTGANGIIVIGAAAKTPLGPKIVFANDAMSALTGYDLHSLIGSPLGLVYDHSDLRQLISRLPEIAQSPNYCWMDRELLIHGGRKTKVRWTIRPTQRAEKAEAQHFTLTVGPIPQEGREVPPASSPAPSPKVETDSPPRDEALAMAAGGVAHDFKNALQAIKSNLEMAQGSAGGLRELEGYLEDAQLALEDAETLAHQMLNFTRGEESNRCVFDPIELLKRVSHLCTAGSKVKCHVLTDPHLRPIEADPNRIYQVLHNLVTNACQAMPNGGTVHLSAANVDFAEDGNVYSVAAGRYTVISVRDRGCGIPPEVLPKIFDRRFSTKANGSGFGLASCQAIIESYGGVIRAASRVGVGTEFLLFLPSSLSNTAVTSTQTTPKPSRIEPITTRKAVENARILVVDDQPGVVKATCGMLRHLGYETVTAENGEEAINQFHRHQHSPEPIDAVLLDMTLPGGLSGEEVMTELMEIDANVRVIAMSGYFEGGPSEPLRNENFAGLLAKPYSMDSLAITLNEILSA